MISKFCQLLLILSLLGFLNACSSGQYTKDDGSCGNCPSTCTTCSTQKFCTACQPTYYLVSDVFTVTCQNCQGLFPACASCNANFACLSCNNGFYLDALNGGICQLCQNSIKYCSSCSPTGALCNQCAYPYILVNNACISAVVNNVLASGTTSPNTNNQSSNSTPTVIVNGKPVPIVLDSHGCNQVQIYINDKCITPIPNCLLYQGNGLCQICKQDYLVTIYGNCAPNTPILACEYGYWLNKVTDKCIPVSPSCNGYYSNGSCVTCASGYAFNSKGECIQNIVCNTRQFFYNGVCVTVPDYCISFSSIDGSCTSCSTGYVLNGASCIVQTTSYVQINTCVFPCNTCHFIYRDYCFSCIINYHLLNAQYGTCLPNV